VDKDIIGAIVLVALLIVQQYFNRKKGITNATEYEQESARITKQTSETVNRCSSETKAAMGAIARHLEKNDLGHVSARLEETVRMLAKMGEHQNACLNTLDRVSSLVRSIADDLQKTDSRIVHEQIQSKVHNLEDLIKDVKRIVLDTK